MLTSLLLFAHRSVLLPLPRRSVAARFGAVFVAWITLSSSSEVSSRVAEVRAGRGGETTSLEKTSLASVMNASVSYCCAAVG